MAKVLITLTVLALCGILAAEGRQSIKELEHELVVALNNNQNVYDHSIEGHLLVAAAAEKLAKRGSGDGMMYWEDSLNEALLASQEKNTEAMLGMARFREHTKVYREAARLYSMGLSFLLQDKGVENATQLDEADFRLWSETSLKIGRLYLSVSSHKEGIANLFQVIEKNAQANTPIISVIDGALDMLVPLLETSGTEGTGVLTHLYSLLSKAIPDNARYILGTSRALLRAGNTTGARSFALTAKQVAETSLRSGMSVRDIKVWNSAQRDLVDLEAIAGNSDAIRDILKNQSTSLERLANENVNASKALKKLNRWRSIYGTENDVWRLAKFGMVRDYAERTALAYELSQKIPSLKRLSLPESSPSGDLWRTEYNPMSIKTTYDLRRLIMDDVRKQHKHFVSKEHKWVSDKTNTIRVGLLSSSFKSHAIGIAIKGFLHSRALSLAQSKKIPRVRIYCFDVNPDKQQINKAIEQLCDHHVPLEKESHAAITETISRKKMHILIDLDGIGPRNNIFTLLRHPAPIVISWMGVPGTVGLGKKVDLLVGDAISTPAHLVSNYDEKIMYMPKSFQIHPHHLLFNPLEKGQSPAPASDNPHARIDVPVESHEEHGLHPRAFTYCSFSRPDRIDSELIKTWANILKYSENSQLWLLRDDKLDEARLRPINDALAASGAKDVNERVKWAPALPPAGHLARLPLCDLYLDTPGYNSITNAGDVLFSGVPLLTMPLETMASRAGASQLTTFLGESDATESGLIVNSLEEYERVAVGLSSASGTNLSRRAKLRAEFVMKATEWNPLFDHAAYTADYIACLQSAWEVEITLGKKRHVVCGEHPSSLESYRERYNP